MPEQTVAADLVPGTEAWAKHHREAIQQRVKIRASNASALMQEIEKIRPYGDEEVAKRGRKPRVDPRTKRPFAHVLLGFRSWTDFVKTPQPEGLGWSPDHERTMWNGWMRAKKASITPEMVDELGQAWLADVGANRNSAAKGLTLEKAQAQIDEKRAKADPAKKRRAQKVVDEEKAAKAEAGPKPNPITNPLEKRPSKQQDKPKEVPLTTTRAPKQLLSAFLEQVAPVIEPKAALKVSQAVLSHLEPEDMVLVAREVVPKLESEHLTEILKDMVNVLDAEEASELARVAVRRLQVADLERVAQDVADLIEARKSREGAAAPKPTKALETDEADEADEAEDNDQDAEGEASKPAKKAKSKAKAKPKAKAKK